MTIPTSATSHPVIPPNAQIPAIDPKTGQWTNAGLQLLQQVVRAINGITPTIACNVVESSNLYTLTPLSIAPVFYGYVDYTSFGFVAPATSTGLVTATVVPYTGSATTLKVYTGNGAAQATVGDITINLFYLLYYVDSLDSGNGGFVVK